ncbi:MAG: hypothetical protein M4579_001469 [Chaenotheca gracillima]|nr:MAG: hypothetical protein M4579_001469 [Chaenotheca gracillima]
MTSTASVFSLEGKGLKLDTAADVEPHIKALRENSTVTEIRLGGNTLGVEASKALADVLETKTTLQVANLDDIFTSRLLNEIPQALSSLLSALLKLPSLHTVDLSDNAFGLNTQAPLVEFLSQHTPLRHLILKNNGLGPKAGTLIADALSTLHEKKESAKKEGKEDVPELETVICGRNRLENGSMEAWAKAFSLHKGVKEVKMVQNGIRQEGIAHLLKEGLRYATSLRVLDLQDNTFTILGARALVGVVNSWTDLTELGVSDCLLTARGGIVLADSLSKGQNSKLEILRLQYNDIDSKGLKGFAIATKSHLPSLKRLELNGNKFSEEDPVVDELRELLDERNGDKDGDEEEWGLDDLSDLEEESDEDEEEDEEKEEEEEEEEKAEKIIKEADKAENENVAQEDDKSVDALADQLGKTGL